MPIDIDKDVLKIIEPKGPTFKAGDKVIVYGFDGQMFLGTILEETQDTRKIELTHEFYDYEYEDENIREIEHNTVEYEIAHGHVKSVEKYLEDLAKAIAHITALGTYLSSDAGIDTEVFADMVGTKADALMKAHPERDNND